MSKKQFITITGLIISIALNLAWTKPKYEGFDFSTRIPYDLPGWQSIDISQQIIEKNKLNNLIGTVFARAYMNQYGEQLLFMILDAGNFHNPKVCYGSSGFNIQELSDTEFKFAKQTIKAPTILFKNERLSQVLIYWLCVDKKIAGWGQQKIIEMFNSLMNQKKTRLMVRVEVPTKDNNVEKSIKLAESFFHDLYSEFPSQYVEYVFGAPNIK